MSETSSTPWPTSGSRLNDEDGDQSPNDGDLTAALAPLSIRLS